MSQGSRGEAAGDNTDGGLNYPKTRGSYRTRGTEAEWRYGIECSLALPRPCYELDLCWPMFSPRTSSSSERPDNVSCEAGPGLGIEIMPSGTTTQSRYQLDLILNALWHYHTVPLSAGLGIECPLALPHSPVISWTWY